MGMKIVQHFSGFSSVAAGGFFFVRGGKQTTPPWQHSTAPCGRSCPGALTLSCGRAVMSSPGVQAAAAPVSAPQASSAVCLLFRQSARHPIGLPYALANWEKNLMTRLKIGGEEL